MDQPGTLKTSARLTGVCPVDAKSINRTERRHGLRVLQFRFDFNAVGKFIAFLVAGESSGTHVFRIARQRSGDGPSEVGILPDKFRFVTKGQSYQVGEDEYLAVAMNTSTNTDRWN